MEWMEELRQIICERGPFDESKLQTADTLKRVNIPSSLFKYRAIGDNSLQNLRDSSVYLAPANSFNDPYDSAFSYDPFCGQPPFYRYLKDDKDFASTVEEIGVDSDEVYEAWSEFLFARQPDPKSFSRQQIEDFVRALRARGSVISDAIQGQMNDWVRESFNICALSARLDSLPLWAHYADEHRGFVMEYDFTSLESNDLLLDRLWPVFYTGVFDGRKVFGELPAGSLDTKYLPLIAAIHKAPDWGYEAEWRLVTTTAAGSYKAPLRAVYVGTQITDDDLDKVVQAAASASVPVYRMKYLREKFCVVPEQNPL